MRGHVTITFKVITVHGEQVPALVIAVTAAEAQRSEEADWEGLSDYVSEEFAQLRSQLRREVQNALETSCGQYVTLNGRVIY
jgi:hypothetical protein